ncbi:MAG: hypothetical protein ABMA25_00060 [Ilumatobacteraceae bacterium]
MRIGRGVGGVVAVGALLAAACSDSSSRQVVFVTAPTEAEQVPAVLADWWANATAGQWRSLGHDQIEVWVCHVPDGATDPIYGGLPLRLPLTPADVVATITEPVSAYFATVSNGQYRPEFVVGGEYEMAVDDAPQACIDAALDAAADDTRAVLAVADAEHGADQVGGFAIGGDPCAGTPPCSARDSRRFAYVGASDFHPDWGDAPPMDLVEHELGHTFGWQHSAVTADLVYESAIDVMSNSAGPRVLEPTRRDAADTIALNKLMAGWLPLADVWVAPFDVADVRLAPASGSTGTRLAVLPTTDGFLTVELLTADGFDDHLPADGIAVHRVSLQGGLITEITPVFGAPPYTSLLQPGDSIEADEWAIAVGDGWTITVVPAQTG